MTGPKIIIFIGRPGSGKGTQADALVAALGIKHLSTGDMLRDERKAGSKLGLLAAGFMDSGVLVPDHIMIDIVVDRLKQPDCAAGILLDGFPRTLLQAQALGVALKDSGRAISAVVYLEVDRVTALKRIGERCRGADDQYETAVERQMVYETETAPVIYFYELEGLLSTIDGSGSVKEVSANLDVVIASIRGSS
jgi:adenylate kinase